MTPRGLAHVMADAFFPPRCLLCDEVLGFLPECPACRGEMARLSRMRMPAVNAVPRGMPAIDPRSVGRLSCGVELGRWDGKYFKPSHALAMAFGTRAKRKLSLSREESVRYLRGEPVPADLENGWCAVCVEEFPLGLGKCVNGVVKNHLPKGLRMLR